MSLRSLLLGSVFALFTLGSAQAADLPTTKAAPIEFVRVCGAYGAGFFYVPGTDTCLRISGRARFEGGYYSNPTRQYGTNGGDTATYIGRLRISMDARTQTDYGTLRAFVRLEMYSRTGLVSGTPLRSGIAFPGLGIDSFGRVVNSTNVDKAFIQFSGLTAGRASSFFDFYAHDFEHIGATNGSDVSSTNLLAYTAVLGNGWSATLAAEDPIFRRTPIFSPSNNPTGLPNNSNVAIFGQSVSPSPVFVGYDGANPTRYSFVDSIERSRLPDFVGALRLDQSWGSAQLSAASHELNVGNLSTAAATGTAGVLTGLAHTNSRLGFAVQGGLKVNLPFIAAGDALYLQGAYGNGAQLYTGYSSYAGSYTQATNLISGQKFTQYFSDAVVNSFTGQLETSKTVTGSVSYLHYWSPEWRSAFFGSYGQEKFSASTRLAQGAIYGLVNPVGTNNFGTNAVGTPGTRFYAISQALRDTYQVVLGGNIIWSPVRDLDIGVEGLYTQIGLKDGRAIDIDKDPTAYSAARIASINAGGPVRTATQDNIAQIRFRVQRDF